MSALNTQNALSGTASQIRSQGARAGERMSVGPTLRVTFWGARAIFLMAGIGAIFGPLVQSAES